MNRHADALEYDNIYIYNFFLSSYLRVAKRRSGHDSHGGFYENFGTLHGCLKKLIN